MMAFIAFVAPKGMIDFMLKLAGLIVLVLAVDIGQELLLDGWPEAGFWNNTRAALIVATPFCALGLLLIQHLYDLQLRLAQLAGTDLLTELPNRRAFMDIAGPTLVRGGVVMMLDVDHFKRVNDTYGHAVGDACLRAIATHIKGESRVDDVVARLGGEEFGVILPQTGSPEVAAIGQRLCAGIILPVGEDVPGHRVTLSIGAVETEGAQSIDELLHLADAALYRAKRAGRARVVVHDPDTSPEPEVRGGAPVSLSRTG